MYPPLLGRPHPKLAVVSAGGAEAGASLGLGAGGGARDEDEGLTEFWEFQRRIPFSGFSVNGLTPCFAMADGASPEGLPEDFLIPNPGGATNLVREARGYYRLWVRHFNFEEGALQARHGMAWHGMWPLLALQA